MSLPTTPGLPAGAQPLIATSNQAAASIASAQLVGYTSAQISGLTATITYLTRMTITAGGATLAAMTTVQLTGLTNGQTQKFAYGATAGAGEPSPTLDVMFDPPQPAAAANTAIKAEMGSLGSGNTHALIVLQGFHV